MQPTQNLFRAESISGRARQQLHQHLVEHAVALAPIHVSVSFTVLPAQFELELQRELDDEAGMGLRGDGARNGAGLDGRKPAEHLLRLGVGESVHRIERNSQLLRTDHCDDH